MRQIFILIISSLFLLVGPQVFSQANVLYGKVTDGNKPVANAQIAIQENQEGMVTDSSGYFEIRGLKQGTYTLTCYHLSYQSQSKSIQLSSENPRQEANFDLDEATFILDDIVVTGSKTFQRRSASNTLVNILTSRSFERVQACNLAEGLNFQSGLRVETDCQTCNYTQLRMNGLAGAYSQILINGRPVFSPLISLYGLEQLPVEMIDRVEVVRGGASSLYGSGAIGGTINVITKIPETNSTDIRYLFRTIGNEAPDHQLGMRLTRLADKGKTGITAFAKYRNRQWYDANGDQFSEIPALTNYNAGFSAFYAPTQNQKWEWSASYVNEYRLGGEMASLEPHLLGQAEERLHNIWVGSTEYSVRFPGPNARLTAYAAASLTQRKHYTGILPDKTEPAYENHLEHPPYGDSHAYTANGGIQYQMEQNFSGTARHNLTAGVECLIDQVKDQIPAYSYLVDQLTVNPGLFAQSEVSLFSRFSLLAGLRLDKHNFVPNPVLSPRISALYKTQAGMQFRLAYGAGFRAPQAFDTDLHIAFAGGGVSRVRLSNQLRPERSGAWSASVNYDHATEARILGFTADVFYNRLRHAFVLEANGQDDHGLLFEKRNGQGAKVAGISLDSRINWRQVCQLEAGFTWQKSFNEQAVSYSDQLAPISEFLRTPSLYGYGVFSYQAGESFNFVLNAVYTGPMQLVHYLPEGEDRLVQTEGFWDAGLKLSYVWKWKNSKMKPQLSAGVKNVFNAYQGEFDSGKNRDSNYVYGPASPRQFYVEMVLGF